MDRASPDLLLMIFKELNSIEMVSVMRVERKWLQIIDEHKSLWRELVLPSKKNGWGLQALKLFDRKTNSTLQRVSMDVAEEVESGPFVATLEKSKDTLQVLETKRNYGVKTALEENLWKFQALVDCRLTRPSTLYYRLKLQLQDRDEDQEDDKGSSLRVLWISNSVKLLKSHLYLLDNLVSLVAEDQTYDSLEMRRILERPSRTLKHLEITIGPGEEPRVPTLSFPKLKFLDIHLDISYFRSVFPSWMELPFLFTLIIHSVRTLSSLPACSKLWLIYPYEYRDLSKLVSQCPELLELRIHIDHEWGVDSSARERFENISSMLSQRKANVEAGMEIEGVKMINLKTLVVAFEHVAPGGEPRLKEARLWKLRELVEEVVDLDEARSEIIEMEV